MMASERQDSDKGVDRYLAAEGEDYRGGGAKKSHHGYTFQFHLLMLFAVRAFNRGYHNFKLGTEVADAHKLDDIVFSYPKDKKEETGRYFRLVQTKHTLKKQKEILKAAHLLEEPNKDFSLRMYFNAYRTLMHGGKLLGKCDEIQDLILCTNMDFKYGDRMGDLVIEEQTFVINGKEGDEEDDIFKNELKKFRSRFQGREELILHLKNGAIRIPSKFAECVVNEMEFSIDKATEIGEPQLIELYENVLRNEVADMTTLKFRGSFTRSENSSSVAKHYRDELWAHYNKSATILGKEDKKTFSEFLEGKKLHFSDEFLSVRGAYLDSPKQLAKRLSRILDKHRNCGVVQVISEKSILWKHFKCLMKYVLTERAGRITFSKEFLQQESLPGNLKEFRDYLEKSLSYFKVGLKDLEKYSFEIDSSAQMVVSDNILDDDVTEFLKILTFSLNQPSIEQMETLILEEIEKHFKETDVRNAYLRFFKMMYSWAESKDGKYLTENDVGDFFHRIQKEFLGSVRFNLIDPVQKFVGRECQLKELYQWLHRGEQCLQSPCGRKAVISQSKAISGLGGIGKSELARKYAQLHFRSLYDNIIWIDAEGNENLEKCFYMLAFDVLGIKKENLNGDKKATESVIWETYKYFEGKRTLFIFDNADLNSNMEPYFPKLSENDHMYVIVTSRSLNWGDIDVLSLDNFSLDEAVNFIKICIGHLPKFNENDAIVLADTLNCFPLAMKQAISYIGEMSQRMENLGKEFTISHYVGLFDKKTKEILDYNFPRVLHNSYSQTTFKTMKIAIDYVKKSENGDVAIHLLNAMSYLSPNEIDLKVLCCSLVNYDDINLAAGLELLKRFSIISVKESKASVHRLIQLVNRVCLKDIGKEREILVEVLNFVYLMEVEHAILAWNCASEYADVVEKFATTPLWILEHLTDKSMVKAAVEFSEKAIYVLKSHLGPNHPEVLFTRRGVGRALYFNGKSKESVAIFQEVIEGQKMIYGENPDVLWTMGYLGVSLVQLGKFNESLTLFMEILSKGELMLEEDSKLLYSTKMQVARVLGLLGHSEESRKYLEDSRKHSQKVLDEHKLLSALHSKIKLDSSPGLEGNFYKQSELIKMRIQKGSYNGADIDDLIQAHVNFLMLYGSNGNYLESLKESEEAYKLVKLKLGETHMKTVNTKTMVAINLFHLGKTDLALQMFREIKKTQLEVVGRMDLGTIHTKYKIGDILMGQFKFQEALKEYEECVNDIRDFMGEEDSFRVHCMQRVALISAYLGKPADAVSILGECFTILQRNSEMISSSKFDVITAMENVASVLVQKQNKREALQAYKNVYHLKKQYKGENHIETLETKFIFSEIYCGYKGKSILEKGVHYLVELHFVLCDKLSEKDPRVEAVMMKIYKILIQLGEFEKVRDMLINSHKEGIRFFGNDYQFVVTVKNMTLRVNSLLRS